MRPQLLDRFGMCVNVVTMTDTAVRTQMVLDKIAYDKVGFQQSKSNCTACSQRCDCILDRLQDPDRLCESAEEEQRELRSKLQAARDTLKAVEMPMEVSRPRD